MHSTAITTTGKGSVQYLYHHYRYNTAITTTCTGSVQYLINIPANDCLSNDGVGRDVLRDGDVVSCLNEVQLSSASTTTCHCQDRAGPPVRVVHLSGLQ